MKILNSDDAIEAFTEAHCMMIRAIGTEPTEAQRNTYREGLRVLVKLARNEYALGIAKDAEQVGRALKD